MQQHGLVFEAWVHDTFFESYHPPSYTEKWDIPAATNHAHGGVPVNPKAAKYGTAIALVVGFWRQQGDEKRFVNIVAPRLEAPRLRAPVRRPGRSDQCATAAAFFSGPPASSAAASLRSNVSALGALTKNSPGLP